MPHALDSPENPDAGFSCLLFIAHYFGVPADTEQLRHEFAEHEKQLDEMTLLRMVRRPGFKTSAVDSEWPRLSAIALPAMALQHDGRYVVIARADNGKVLIHDPAEPRPLTLPRDIFEPAWSGRLILFTQRAGSGLGAEGKGGDDTFIGSNGRDDIIGGDGADIYRYSNIIKSEDEIIAGAGDRIEMIGYGPSEVPVERAVQDNTVEFQNLIAAYWQPAA